MALKRDKTGYKLNERKLEKDKKKIKNNLQGLFQREIWKEKN